MALIERVEALAAGSSGRLQRPAWSTPPLADDLLSLRCVFTDRTLCFRAVGDGLVEVNTVASDVGSLLTVVNWRMNATKVTLHLDNSTGWLRPFTHVSLGSSGEPLSWSIGSDAHTVAIAPFRLEVSCHDIPTWGCIFQECQQIVADRRQTR